MINRLPNRPELFAYLRCLWSHPIATFRHQWASDLLGIKVVTFASLDNDKLDTLIGELSETSGVPQYCRSIGPDGQQCICAWPGHPVWCSDINGLEWMAREI
jgi:hypothetical protein